VQIIPHRPYRIPLANIMKTITTLILSFLLSSILYTTHAQTNEKTQNNDCDFYYEGLEYFNSNYHGDYMNNGSRDTAILIFEKAALAGCKEYDLYYKLFFCYEWERDYKNAEKYISLAISVDTTKHELYYWKGEMNMHLKNLDEALKDYQKYVSYKSVRNLQTGYYRCGAILYAMGDKINSEKYMLKAVELNGGKKLRDFKEFGKSWGMIK
jgi:tetratricopeptide (TPR) repeat protein